MTPNASDEPAGSGQPASFETALADLGEVVAKLESGSLGLSDSIAAYERGVALLRRLHDELAVAEKKVSVLVRIDDEGRPVLAPHDAPEASPPAAARAGRKPRSRTLPGMDDAGDGV
ncbi:MAG: exodeoxyribonuclease VII small subunit [Pirellulales bacterium]